MNCPNCGSNQITSNRIDESLIDNVAHATQTAGALNYPTARFAGIALWGGLRAINALRKEWRCSQCGVTFDESSDEPVVH